MTKKTIPLVDYQGGYRLVIGEATIELENFAPDGPGGGVSVKLKPELKDRYSKVLNSDATAFSIGPGWPPSEASVVPSDEAPDVRTPFQKAIDKLGLKEKHG